MSDKIKYTSKDAKMLNTQRGPSVDIGYAVATPSVSANDQTNWTVSLVKPNNKYLNIWAEDITADFSIYGTTGQSRWRRQFYPHSFNEPTLKITGTMPSQKEYNKLAAFVRESHAEALNVGGGLTANVNERSKATKPIPTVSLYMRPHRRDVPVPRNQKGGRRGMKLEGYIGSIDAGSTKFEFAPKFEIRFIIAASDGSVGVYDDKLVTGSKVVSWMQLFKQDQFGAKSGTAIRELVGSDFTPVKTPPATIAADAIQGIQDQLSTALNITSLSPPNKITP